MTKEKDDKKTEAAETAAAKPATTKPAKGKRTMADVKQGSNPFAQNFGKNNSKSPVSPTPTRVATTRMRQASTKGR